MPTKTKKTPRKAPASGSRQEWLQDELASLHRGYTKAMKSPKSARAILQKAGILNAKGQLAKPYRESS